MTKKEKEILKKLKKDNRVYQRALEICFEALVETCERLRNRNKPRKKGNLR